MPLSAIASRATARATSIARRSLARTTRTRPRAFAPSAFALGILIAGLASPPSALTAQPADSTRPLLLLPDRVFDGTGAPPATGVAVLVRGGRIAAVDAPDRITVPPGTRTLALPGTTLLPGLIDLHSHVLLHPYDEVPWEDQVLREPQGERTARAVVHLARTLAAGFTSLRDLGTEGAGSADVGLRSALRKGVVPGPRLVVAERAIVMRGSYAPRSFAPEVPVAQGAEEAGNASELVDVVRRQIQRGADVIKVYADYRWGPDGEARPAFTSAELEAAVAVASSSGRPVVAHASTADGMRRAALAGVQTIEHGDGGTAEVFALMRDRGVVLVPTVAAGHAIEQYRGWRPGVDPEPARVRTKCASVRSAREAGVTIANGSDVGVFTHGDNARELELLVACGLTPTEALVAATRTAGAVLGLRDSLGVVRAGAIADLVVVAGDPTGDIAAVRAVRLVVQGGRIVRDTAP